MRGPWVWAAGLVGVVLVGAVLVWTLTDSGNVPRRDLPHADCEPVSMTQAEKAVDRFAERYLDDSTIQDVGITDVGEGSVIVVTVTPGEVADLPQCFLKVPVRQAAGGPSFGY